MRHIKLFKKTKIERDLLPSVGDYVICKVDEREDEVFINFISKNIGRLKLIHDYNTEYKYCIKYKNTESVSGYINSDYKECINMRREEILFWSNRKKDCEVYLSAKKYNL